MTEPSDVYYECLFTKKRGHPLFTPEPDENWPDERRKVGIDVGDVGILTPDGSFDVLYNLLKPANHPLNWQGAPKNHQPITLPAGGISRRQYYSPGTVVKGGHLMTTSISTSAGFQAPLPQSGFEGGFQFEASSEDAAALVLPDGAIREKLLAERAVRRSTERDAVAIYEFAEELGRLSHSRERLFVVCSLDKTTAWGIAASSGSSLSAGLSSAFSFMPTASGDVNCSFKWDHPDSVTVRKSTGDTNDANQTVFVRGFHITRSPLLFRGLSRPKSRHPR